MKLNPRHLRAALVAILTLAGLAACYGDIVVEGQAKIAQCEQMGGRSVVRIRDARSLPGPDGMLKSMRCVWLDSVNAALLGGAR